MTSPFSGFVFKVQSGMNSSHRDYVAFVRVCSGQFRRGMVVTHSATGRPFATKYAQQLFGKDREVAEEAWPGDIVGLVNASALRVGDWRGRTVTVCGSGSCVNVKLIDWCACGSGRVIDLYSDAFSRLAPLSSGTLSVRVSW